MSDPNKYYRLVFTGELLPGFSKKKVVSQLQAALHLDKKNAERLVEGKHRQIDKKLTLDRAEKLRFYILERGADCVLLPIEDSFIDTEQLPEFVTGENDTKPGLDSTELDSEASKESNIPSSENAAETQQATLSINNKPSTVDANSKLKYLLFAILLLIVGGVVIWMVRPVSEQSDGPILHKDASKEHAELSSSVTGQAASVKSASTAENDTDGKLQNLSVRTGLWFADHGGQKDPASVSWIWIQGDLGISVRDMNDSWGNAIMYIGNNDGFEMRSSGPDELFYTDDDLFRETNLD